MKILFKKKLLIIFVLLLAFFLRVVNINTSPPALYGDELTLIYDAYSILQTGRDQTGDFLPLTFTMSEGRPPFYVYASVPLVAIFGPNALSARLLSVFSGVGIVLLTYLLINSLISKRMAFIAAFFMAISPWDLSLSRGGFETHLALFLALLGIYSFLKAKSQPWYLLVSAISFGLTLFTYHSYKVVIPALLPFLIWFASTKQLIYERKYRRCLILGGSILAVFITFWLSLVLGGSEVRFQNTSILSKPDLQAAIIEKINTERNIDNLPFKNLIHNKPIEYLLVLGENYLSHFSFNFLFLHGDANPRHNQGLMGEMYVADILLILLGIIYLWYEYRKLVLFLGAWVMVAPLATILVSPAHALRSTFLLPPLIMLSAAGFSYLWELSKKELLAKLVIVSIMVGIAVQFIFLIDRVYFLYQNQFGKFWSVSAKVASEESMQNSQKYEYIILSDSIDSINLAFPVYSLIDPQVVIDQYDKIPVSLNGYKFKQFGNTYIGNIPAREVSHFLKGLSGKALYLGPVDVETKQQNYDTIYGADNLPLLVKISNN